MKAKIRNMIQVLIVRITTKRKHLTDKIYKLKNSLSLPYKKNSFDK